MRSVLKLHFFKQNSIFSAFSYSFYTIFFYLF
nr:MAG TPA: hypothetical protein [Caudoviricetes sp.]